MLSIFLGVIFAVLGAILLRVAYTYVTFTDTVKPHLTDIDMTSVKLPDLVGQRFAWAKQIAVEHLGFHYVCMAVSSKHQRQTWYFYFSHPQHHSIATFTAQFKDQGEGMKTHRETWRFYSGKQGKGITTTNEYAALNAYHRPDHFHLHLPGILEAQKLFRYHVAARTYLRPPMLPSITSKDDLYKEVYAVGQLDRAWAAQRGLLRYDATAKLLRPSFTGALTMTLKQHILLRGLWEKRNGWKVRSLIRRLPKELLEQVDAAVSRYSREPQLPNDAASTFLDETPISQVMASRMSRIGFDGRAKSAVFLMVGVATLAFGMWGFSQYQIASLRIQDARLILLAALGYAASGAALYYFLIRHDYPWSKVATSIVLFGSLTFTGATGAFTWLNCHLDTSRPAEVFVKLARKKKTITPFTTIHTVVLKSPSSRIGRSQLILSSTDFMRVDPRKHFLKVRLKQGHLGLAWISDIKVYRKKASPRRRHRPLLRAH